MSGTDVRPVNRASAAGGGVRGVAERVRRNEKG